ncbi:MAG TPA: biotin transporter BioY [Vicinamibacterales bacterium]|nr:biotin transporter BioY [Vicinamibacterales bacterium]
MSSTRAPFVTYDSTLLDHVSIGADSSASLTSIKIASVLFLTALTAAAAQISVHLPFTPVPFTLQPMVVLVGSAALGARLGAASQILYLLLGIAGAPVFAASPILPQGAARLLGPTGGYLMAYPIAAFVTGYLAERGFDRRYFTSVLAMLAGLCMLFLGGVTWLALFATSAAGPVGVQAALATGLYPFVVPDIVKVCLASAILPTAWAVVGRAGDR